MQIITFSLNLGTSNKNFETTKQIFPEKIFSNGIRTSKKKKKKKKKSSHKLLLLEYVSSYFNNFIFLYDQQV